MTVRSRLVRGGFVGLCLLLVSGTVHPTSAAADPTSSPAPTPAVTSVSPAPSTSTPSASASYSLKPDDFSLTVSPARIALGPQTLGSTQQISVINRGRSSVDVTVERRNFRAATDGSLTFDPDAPWGAADWVTTAPNQFSLAPGATQVVRADVTVPPAPEVGDHQVAIVFLVPARGAEGNVRINRGIGTPVYLTVPGPVDDSVVLEGLRGPRYSFSGRPTLTATLRNTGTVHRDFRGPTALSVGTAGHQTRFTDFTVPRGATRVTTTRWTAPLVCVCRVSTGFRNADGSAQQATTRVVVVPWWLLTAVGVLLIGSLLLALVRRRRRIRPARALAGPPPDDGGGDG